MPTAIDIPTQKRELADTLIANAQRTPPLSCGGQYVGIANGQVVVITDDLAELALRLKEAESDPGKTLIVEPARNLGEVHQIWEIR